MEQRRSRKRKKRRPVADRTGTATAVQDVPERFDGRGVQGEPCRDGGFFGGGEEKKLGFDRPGEFLQAREVFATAGYKTAAISKLLKVNLLSLPSAAELPEMLRRTDGGSPFETFVRLFVLGVSAEVDAVRRALDPVNPDAWAKAGMLAIDGETVTATLRLLPFQGLLVATESVADTQTLPRTLTMARAFLCLAGSDVEIKEVPADKGYHRNEALTWCQSFGIRTYIPERESRGCRRWTDKSKEEKSAVYKNRRRVRGKRGKQLGRLRSEYTERSFAHVCGTGGARRIRLRSLIDVGKRYLMYVAARNLGVLMRALFNRGTPRSLPTEGEASPCAVGGWLTIVSMPLRRVGRSFVSSPAYTIDRLAHTRVSCAA